MNEEGPTGVFESHTGKIIACTPEVVKALLDWVGHLLMGMNISHGSKEWQQRHLELMAEYRKAVEGEK